MDWLLRPATAEAGSTLRGELGGFLRRHAANESSVAGAELVVSELIANAIEHTAGPVWVSLDWSAPQPVLTVHDLGPAFALEPSLPDSATQRGRGLWLVSQFAKDLAVAAKRAGGKQVSVTLPVVRRDEPTFDPPARVVNPLPALEEATPEGFGREAFLRALVVELSRTVEQAHGPLQAQQMVAHVGATVGAQMEQEYRAARQLVDRLTPQELADCYVRLKAAIDGGFYVIDVTPDRIVMGNTRCPFGDTVRHAPALCRMTSSVFGGIAARNHGHATVRLDERIAVGDPECRVTILLGERGDEGEVAGHHYAAAR